MTSTRKAAQAFADFSGHTPQKVLRSKLDDNDVTGWKMGPVVGIAYEAKRDNETKQYFHEFKKSARPNLVARDDGKQLYIDGGKYKVTDRGIEDMPQLFVVNPSPRKGRKSRGKAPMARRRRTTVRRRAPRQVAVFRANPVRRRRRKATRSFRRNPARRAVAVRSNPVRRRRRSVGVAKRRSYRRNPSARSTAMSIGKMFLPAVGIGAGAVGSEILMGYLPIPANFKTGVLRHVTKGVVGVGAGLLIGKVFKMKRLGNFFALGAIAIATHDALKELIASRASGINTSGFGQYRRALPSQFAGRGMGYVNPAATRMGQYVKPLGSQFPAAFAGDAPMFAHPGGETDFSA
jgi:hypothetical protein